MTFMFGIYMFSMIFVLLSTGFYIWLEGWDANILTVVGGVILSLVPIVNSMVAFCVVIVTLGAFWHLTPSFRTLKKFFKKDKK